MEACRRVARWYHQHHTQYSTYELKDVKDIEAFAVLLQGDSYYPWLKANAAWLQREEPKRRKWLTENRHKHLVHLTHGPTT